MPELFVGHGSIGFLGKNGVLDLDRHVPGSVSVSGDFSDCMDLLRRSTIVVDDMSGSRRSRRDFLIFRAVWISLLSSR